MHQSVNEGHILGWTFECYCIQYHTTLGQSKFVVVVVFAVDEIVKIDVDPQDCCAFYVFDVFNI